MKKQSRKVSKLARNTAIALFTCLTFACSGGSGPAPGATGSPMPAKTPEAAATADPSATGTPAAEAPTEGEAPAGEASPSGHIQSDWTLLGFGAPW